LAGNLSPDAEECCPAASREVARETGFRFPAAPHDIQEQRDTRAQSDRPVQRDRPERSDRRERSEMPARNCALGARECALRERKYAARERGWLCWCAGREPRPLMHKGRQPPPSPRGLLLLPSVSR